MRRFVIIAVFLILVSAGISYSILNWDHPIPEAGKSKNEVQLEGQIDHSAKTEDAETGKGLFSEANFLAQSPVIPEEIQINTSRPRITTQLILERYYKFCQHTEIEEMDHTSPLITIPRQELLDLYPGWVIKEDFAGRLILRREINDLCPTDLQKRYVGEKGGFVTVFYGEPGMKNKVYRNTEIPVAGFPLQIKAQLKIGIPSESESHLISIIEGLEVYYGE